MSINLAFPSNNDYWRRNEAQRQQEIPRNDYNMGNTDYNYDYNQMDNFQLPVLDILGQQNPLGSVLSVDRVLNL